jgi:uncharacterized DUF497 family protein
MLYVREILFDDWNEDHIAQHHVIPEEVEEVCLDDPFVSKTRKGRLRVIGQTNAGRYLAIILAPRGRGMYYPITARDATIAERRLYRRQKGQRR